MIQKKRVIATGKQYFLGLIAVVGVVSALWCQSFVSLAEPDVPGAEVEPNTVLDAQYAVITKETVNIRTAPSTNDGVVDKLNRDAQVIVSGETQGSDGMTWYYVTFMGTSGTEKSGYIRSDLLSLGEMVPTQEEEVPEQQEIEPEPEVAVNNDYELKCETTSDGTEVWYIYDYTGGDPNRQLKYPLQELMKVTRERTGKDAENAKALVRQRAAIIVLAVLLVLLIGVVVIMALKLRDVYYGEDEEEEEQEETPMQRRRRMQESEETPIQRRRREGSEGSSTQRRRRTEETEETPTRRRRRTGETEETPTQRRRRMEDADEENVRRRPMRDERGSNAREVEYREDDAGSAPVKTAPKRKAKNFLLDDDEFEFEFLNMEDKN